jgi:hypothetical protein
VVLQPVACRNCGFESTQGDGCLPVVSVVRGGVEDPVTGRLLVQGSHTGCGSLSVFDELHRRSLGQ